MSSTLKTKKKSKAADKVLSAAEKLFYSNGIQSTGIDMILNEAQVSNNTLYRHFKSKDLLVQEYLKRRDKQWRQWLEQSIRDIENPKQRLLAIFDALEKWSNEDDFRGCAFINSAGEHGSDKAYVHDIAKYHKEQVLSIIKELTLEAQIPDGEHFAQLFMILIEGAIINTYVRQDDTSFSNAKEIAELLLRAKSANDE